MYNLLIIIVLMTSSIAIFYNLFNGTALLDNYSGTIQSLGFITVSLVCFYYIISKLEINSLKKSVLFWVNTGNSIYFSGRFFICLFLLQVLDPKVNGLEGYWIIMTIFLVIQRICICIGISQTENMSIGKQ